MNAAGKYIYNHRTAQKMLVVFNLCWLAYYSYQYATVLVNRPRELYEPLSWFGKLLTPVFPSPAYYFSVVIAAAVSGSLILFKIRYKSVFQVILVLGLLFVNSVNWSYGYLSHVGHIIILASLLAVFLPAETNENQQQVIRSFKWYYAGILSTYSLSAYWKIREIADDIMHNDYSDSWFNLAATKNTVVCGYVWMEEPLPAILSRLLPFESCWLAAFIITTCIMLAAPLSVLSQKYFRIMLVFLVLFHLSNILLLRAEFFATPVMLILFFVPYHVFIPERLRH